MSGATVVASPPARANPYLLVDDRSWFDRSAEEVAPDLIGMVLIHDTALGRIAGRIVEVEAYLGPEDLAAHSARGLRPRNRTMFGPPGHLYVYLIYGLHHCANVVCGPGDKPEAVLLRAAAVLHGEEHARRRRGAVPASRLASGPGNLGAAFGLDLSLNGADLLAGPVRLGFGRPPGLIASTPRIGVASAGSWAGRRLRFLDPNDPHRSGR